MLTRLVDVVLEQLFYNKAFKNRLLFKGAMSLSEIFYAINRFSEDIDLAVDEASLGFSGEKEPAHTGLSNSRR